MQRVTISVPDEVLATVRERVAAGEATSVSAYFAAAADERARSRGLAALLDEFDAAHGPVDEETTREVEEVLGRIAAGETGVFDLRSPAPRP